MKEMTEQELQNAYDSSFKDDFIPKDLQEQTVKKSKKHKRQHNQTNASGSITDDDIQKLKEHFNS